MGAILNSLGLRPDQTEKLRRTARTDYATYVTLANPGFYMTHFHHFLCDKVQTFLNDQCKNGAMDILLLSVPPQHGKSYTVTETLPSWFLGQHPTSSVIIAGYGSDLAEKFGRHNRDKYNTIVQEVFLTSSHDCSPNTKVQAEGNWETSQGGACRSVGLKGGITGHGADLFIIDDPIRNRQDATSETIISDLHQEMGPSVQSRIHPGGKLIVIQTRWVENDVIGWIQANWPEYIWEYINLPAEYDDEAAAIGPCPLGRHIGDSLMGWHLGDDETQMPDNIKNTNRWLQSKKSLVIASDGKRTWDALYQGRPTAGTGNLYDPSWWGRYQRSEGLRYSMEYLQLSVDATFKDADSSDFVAMTLWGVKGRTVYLWKLVNMRLSFTATLAKIRELCVDYPDIDELVIEDKANGTAIMDVLRYEDGLPCIVPVQPLGGKYARAQATSSFVAAHNVLLPNDISEAELVDIQNDNPNIRQSGIDVFITQHKTFPFGVHDDMVDSQSQALSRILKMVTGEIPMPERHRAPFYSKWYPDDWQDFYNMTKQEQDNFIARRGAPLEWMDGDDTDSLILGPAPRQYVRL